MIDSDELQDLIKEAVGFIATSARPSAFTGAGMSQESGIPTFRDENGLWMQHHPNDVATAAALHHNPQRVWDFFEAQRALIKSAVPNVGHRMLAQFESAYFKRLPVITQNGDDLHERAGSKSVVHLHGQLMQNRCSRYCQGIPSIIDDSLTDRDTPSVPQCPHCSALLRPDVILFGEYLHGYVYEQAQAIAQRTDLMIIIGTSGLVAPASKIPLMAQDHGATLVEINPQPSRITPNVDVYIPAPCGDVLSRIGQALDKFFGP